VQPVQIGQSAVADGAGDCAADGAMGGAGDGALGGMSAAHLPAGPSVIRA